MTIISAFSVWFRSLVSVAMVIVFGSEWNSINAGILVLFQKILQEECISMVRFESN